MPTLSPAPSLMLSSASTTSDNPNYRPFPHGCLAPEKGQQIGVDLVLVRSREAVRRAWIVDFLCAPDQPSRFSRRVMDRDDLDIFAVHDERRHIDLVEILGEVRFGEGLNAL